jgi:hypothetical protein
LGWFFNDDVDTLLLLLLLLLILGWGTKRVFFFWGRQGCCFVCFSMEAKRTVVADGGASDRLRLRLLDKETLGGFDRAFLLVDDKGVLLARAAVTLFV